MKRFLPLSLLALLPQIASAHPGHDGHDLEWGFNGGFIHPLGGWDHLLAMVAIGIWAAQLGKQARFAVPAAFVGAMALGAALTSFGITLPLVEPLVAASVLALGLAVATSVRIAPLAGAILAAFFALFHGAAHATEFAAPAPSIGTYAGGFLTATVLLHLVGLGIGSALARKDDPRVTGILGSLIALSGLVLFTA